MHTFSHIMDTPQKKPSKPKRTNIYLRNPVLFKALQQAVSLKIIQAGSASERLDEMMLTEARRLLPKFKALGSKLVPELEKLLTPEN